MLSIKEILPSVISGIQSPENLKRNQLVDGWPQIVGPRFAANTRPKMGRGGRLFVWVDQSTLAFELSQKYAPSLLKRTQAAIGEENVKTISFRVGQLRR